MTDPAVFLAPPRVLRAFVGQLQVDMLEGDRLVLTNHGGIVRITLESGTQCVPVLDDAPTPRLWTKVEIGELWGMQELDVTPLEVDLRLGPADAPALPAKLKALPAKRKRGGKRG